MVGESRVSTFMNPHLFGVKIVTQLVSLLLLLFQGVLQEDCEHVLVKLQIKGRNSCKNHAYILTKVVTTFPQLSCSSFGWWLQTLWRGSDRRAQSCQTELRP